MNSTNKHKEVAAHRYLCFSLGDREYSIPLLEVKEVIARPEVSRVPFSTDVFLGITNLRGKVVSIVDLRKKFGEVPKDSTECAVIVVDLGNVNLGLLVDSVNSVVAPKKNEVSSREEVALMVENIPKEFVTGVYKRGKDLILMLEAGSILTPHEKSLLQTAA